MNDISPAPFTFRGCEVLPVSTGLRAQNLKELRDGIVEAPLSSLHYHFWGRMLRPQVGESEYINDFASWVHDSLHLETLAERLSVINPGFQMDFEILREELLDVLEARLAEGDFATWAKGRYDFFFISSRMIVFDIGEEFVNVEDINEMFSSSSRGSVFYHFIEARRRTPRNVDDYSLWLEQFGESTAYARQELAEVDPYLFSLGELREQILTILTTCL